MKITKKGWVPKDESQRVTLKMAIVNREHGIVDISECLYPTKRDAMEGEGLEAGNVIRRTITMTVQCQDGTS